MNPGPFIPLNEDIPTGIVGWDETGSIHAGIDTWDNRGLRLRLQYLHPTGGEIEINDKEMKAKARLAADVLKINETILFVAAGFSGMGMNPFPMLGDNTGTTYVSAQADLILGTHSKEGKLFYLYLAPLKIDLIQDMQSLKGTGGFIPRGTLNRNFDTLINEKKATQYSTELGAAFVIQAIQLRENDEITFDFLSSVVTRVEHGIFAIESSGLAGVNVCYKNKFCLGGDLGADGSLNFSDRNYDEKTQMGIGASLKGNVRVLVKPQ